MFRNTFQSGFLSILYSLGNKPLQLWDKQVENGSIKRIADDEVQSGVLELVGENVALNYITCPADPKKALGIKLPYFVLIIKNLKKYFTFEIQVMDDKNVKRRFRASNFQSTTRVKPMICTMPMRLDEGWNQIQINLADLVRKTYGTGLVETLRVMARLQLLAAATFVVAGQAFMPPFAPASTVARTAPAPPMVTSFVRPTTTALSMSTTAEAPVTPDKPAETFEFQAEVSRVMDIIINSLYSDRDVFLRELVSNAADACDKKRFLSITADGDAANANDFRIRISADKEARTLILEDSGIGMTKTELVENLGRIAQSGTKKFAEALKKGDADLNLIGQFGVGFYSGFLVADRMTVISKPFQGADRKQYRWESSAGSSFTVAEDDSTPIEGSGTRLILHLKEDCDEYMDPVKLKTLLQRYSEFVQFPIELLTEKTDYEQVPDETAAPPAEGEKPKMKTVTKKSNVWEKVNVSKPVWLRSPKSVSLEEYREFYRTTFRMYDEPLNHTHFSLEGQVEFKALLYVPAILPYELARSMFDETSRAIKLYVKRVFINDKFEELLPRYLTFLRGVVDSEDLPLNVGREILQKSKMLNVINKRLVRKSLDMFRDIEKNATAYETFWNNFGRYLKVGLIEDNDNRNELAKLTRWFTTSSPDTYTSLDQYVARMKPEQKQIYYITGETKAKAMASPALERLRKLDYEVLLLADPLDEMAVQSLAKFADKDLIDAAKEMVAETEEEKKELEEKTKETEDLRDWYRRLLGKRVTKVEVSTRLTESPAALVQSAYGLSPQMQKYYKAQAVLQDDDASALGGQFNQAILELNPSHPIIVSLKRKVETSPDDKETLELGKLVFDVAALAGGYDVEDIGAFSARITKLLSKQVMSEGGVDAVVPEGLSTRDIEDIRASPSEQAVTPDVMTDVSDVADMVRKLKEAKEAQDRDIANGQVIDVEESE